MVIFSPIIWLYFIWRAIRAPEYREGFKQRLGFIEKSSTPSLLIHCASVGESKAALPLIAQLQLNYPHHQLIITTTTPTGKAVIQQWQKTFLSGEPSKVKHAYLPVDWRGSCRRFIHRIKPSIAIIMETELWPNLLAELEKYQIPVLLANARLSEKSTEKYLSKKAFATKIFEKISIVAAQYQSDTSNFLKLIDKPEKVLTEGNIKFDISVSTELLESQNTLKQQWKQDRVVWVCASIHPAEFDTVLDAHKKLLEKIPSALLIGIPRHPEKFSQFESTVKARGLRSINRSSGDFPDASTQVVVGDTMGEVMLFCGIADFTFVGGSLIDRGGHNPLEAIACGSPVIMGASSYNFSDVCEALLTANCLLQCQSEEAFIDSVVSLACEPKLLIKMTSNTHQVLDQNRGVVDRLLVLVEKLIRK